MLLIHQLAKSFQEFADQEAMVDGDARYTQGQLLVTGAAFAEKLQDAGVGRGDHVGVMLPNGIGWAGSYLGCQLLGAVTVAVNPLATPSELQQYHQTTKLKVMITGGPLLEAAAKLEGCTTIDAATIKPTPELAPKASKLLKEAVAKAQPNDPAVIIFTSGTTGASKAPLLSQANIGAAILAADDAFDIDAGDKMLIVLPLFHSYGLLIFNLMLAKGGLSVFQAKFHPTKTQKLLHDEAITYAVLVPPMIALLTRVIHKGGDEAKPPALRFLISGGAALPPAIYDGWTQVTGIPLLNGYGQTEAAPLISVNTSEANRFPSVGKPVKNVEVEIWSDEGSQLPVGEIGEVVARGPNIMLGYYGDDEATGKTVTETGWLKTGDFGRLDDDGYLFITGRKKELIIVSGENVYPNEVEDVILGVPGVRECAIVAGHDDLRGEFVRAVLAVQATGQESEAELAALKESVEKNVLEACRADLAAFKVPRTVEFMEALPRNTLGKILKREL
jgi:long-chain acyl-CoA synthetase